MTDGSGRGVTAPRSSSREATASRTSGRDATAQRPSGKGGEQGDGGGGPPGGDLGEFEYDAVGRALPVRKRTVVFLLVTAVVAAAWYYDYRYVTPGLVPPWGWAPGITGYLLYVAVAFGSCYLLVPLAKRPRLTRRYWRRLRRRPLALVSMTYLVAFAFVAMFGPGIVTEFDIGSNPANPYPPAARQPPFWVEGGGWNFPLGTTVMGNDMIDVLVEGARLAFEIAVVTGAVIVPIAVGVGTAAAYYGGRVDELLMRVVEVVQVIPAILVVILLQMLFPRNVMVVILVFGLLEWGGTAQMVRSEALQRASEEYIMAAKSAGLGDIAVIRRHLVPNVSSTVVTSVTQLMPKLIVVEAAIAFLGWSAPFSRSWGATIYTGVFMKGQGLMYGYPGPWWNYLFPGLLLVATTAALHVFGDAMREVLDPRTAGE